MRFKKLQKGFTLTELLVVMMIIALLVFLGLITYLNNLHKANDAKRKTDLIDISTAVESYYTDNDCYPDPSLVYVCGGDGLTPYISSVPCDPVYDDHYCYFVSNGYPEANCYQEYHLLTTLQYTADPEIAKLGCNGDAFCGWEVECGATANRYGYNYGISSQNVALANPDAGSVITGGGSLQPPPDLPPPNGPGQFACAPPGNPADPSVCNNYGTYENAIANGCPVTFTDSGLCQNYCDYSQAYWCSQ